MRPSRLILGIVGLWGWLSLATMHAEPPSVSPGQAALDAAARQGQYLFVLVYKQDDAATQAMKSTLDQALAKMPSRASMTSVWANDPAEKGLMDRWGLSRTPMPIVLAVAPNGAITGGFPLKLTEQDIHSAMVSPGTAACLKGIQARKLVLLCVLPPGVEQPPAGVREFQADPANKAMTELVIVRADDSAEAGFLQTLGINQSTTQPVTAMLLPPGSMIGSFTGEVTKAQLAERLKVAQSGCCPGGNCGPNSCCPPGRK
jgi:hypothetical protein